MSNILSVMYHYVRDNQIENTPNLNSLDIGLFRSQLDWLQDNYAVLSLDELDRVVSGNMQLPEDAFILTFDDGLKDHYTYVLPELKKRGLGGLFYICSKPYLDEFPLDVHIIHFVLDKIGVETFTDMVVEEMREACVHVEGHKFDVKYRYDDESYSMIKKLLNYTLDYDIKEMIIKRIFNRVFDSAVEFNERVYLSRSEIVKMREEGMYIGNHTHSHKVLSRLDSQGQRSEIHQCDSFLRELLGEQSFSFCYPYGHSFTYNTDTFKTLDEVNTSYAFTNVEGFTEVGQQHKYELGRINTNEIPPKKINTKFAP